MDREKAIDWIYGERLIQPAQTTPPGEKRRISEEKERCSPLRLLRHWLHLGRRLADVHRAVTGGGAATREDGPGAALKI